ncbi:hypothetical protein AA101099_1764 [Neoasaia chiangmaiensis NBRC 101099]|uniref:Uncharacterized protein n=1 Tax=Neoasaia chiangmaiensis TaxID=320497 RepID=A0A1U9KRH7_9PROT|nr:hypothetical protein [Neoasaia chiangmaiensis]AQS88280.1 hypothetical protein A0U93_10370 [Neoasaia chiangmaiensis]GBR39665.1 hypothetical protein AA101099_1764 [Neoasaia chiangmaiensis NBRC 101099]GEN14686.1 hypothetical protein NCH01_11170 [Neoasaia chiangmaiensis]
MTLAVGQPIELSDVQSLVNGRLSPTGVGSGLLFTVTGAPSAATGYEIVADEHLMRAYGATFDGSHDDSGAIQAIINASRTLTPAPIALPTILFRFPACGSLIANRITSGAHNISITGAGQQNTVLEMISGGAGGWQHGTQSAPATGYFQFSNAMLQDGNPHGSGSIGIEINAAPSNFPNCLTTTDFTLFKWARPMVVRNVPRGWECRNGCFFGPDYSVQQYGAIDVVSNNTGHGCFSYTFANVMTVNYFWGWRYNVAWQLEGQVFYSCRSYSGWGMVQANVSPSALGSDIADYQSPLWYFTDCDWQGYGYGYDLKNVRNVRIRGGYLISNALDNTSGSVLPPAPGDTTNTPRTRRAYVSLIDCADVVSDGLCCDFSDANGGDTSIFYTDNKTNGARFRGTSFLAATNPYTAFEYQAGGTSNRAGDFDSVFLLWPSGVQRVQDGSNNQMVQSLLRPLAGQGIHADVNENGTMTVATVAMNQVIDSNGNIAVPFPTRSNGAPFFQSPSGPTVTHDQQNALVQVGYGSQVSVTNTGFVLNFGKSSAGTQMNIPYIAKGE